MVDQTQFDTNNDNDLDTLPHSSTVFPPAGATAVALSQSANNTNASDTSTTSSDPSNLDVHQITFEPSTLNPNTASSQENTRARIAWTFTLLFLTLITLSIIGPFGLYFLQAPGMQNPVEVSKELITIVASVLAGPFGFIVGFYFKQNQTDS